MQILRCTKCRVAEQHADDITAYTHENCDKAALTAALVENARLMNKAVTLKIQLDEVLAILMTVVNAKNKIKTKKDRVADVVAEAQKLLAPDVVKICYNHGLDESDKKALFFRVVITDQVNSNNLSLATLTRDYLGKAITAIYSKRRWYVNFRSVSEQAKLMEKEWE
jgi:hypothetical protein